MLPSPPSFLTGDLFSQILYLPEMCQLNLICYILAVGLMMFSNVQVGMTFVILPLSLLFFFITLEWFPSSAGQAAVWS